MKKILPLLLISFLSLHCVKVMAQAKKYVIFEHFTQASCGPCAQQNPAMQATLNANVGRVHHIAYHTSWPGYDPMNLYNAAQVADRVGYYGVTGVPDVVGLGDKYRGSPTGVTQTLVDNLASDAAPIRVLLSETSTGTLRTVTVKIFSIGSVPAANYKIRVAVLEKMIDYATPPGSNGEKDFPDVFRKMLPSTSGASYTPAAVGDSVTFTYTYNLDLATWDTTQIYTCAFIQNETTKDILNSGSTLDPHWELVGIGQNFKIGYPGETVTFNYTVMNLGKTTENFRFKVNSTAASSWDAGFTINGIAYNDSVNLAIPAKTTYDLQVNVVVGPDASLGEYALTMKSLDNPQFAPVVLKSHVIYGVYEIIINNDGGWGDGTGGLTPMSFQQRYIDGLVYAGSTAFGVLDMTSFKNGYAANCLTNVTNYYFNVGWSFPSFTDASAAIFTSELNAGKNLFVSGQDIGWDTFDPSGNGTTATKAFYTNFLCAQYLNDGSTANNQYIANTADTIFGAVPTSPLTNVYGGTNFFPDEIKAIGLGTDIFYYNTAKTKKGAVRATNGNWKTVYLAASLEQMSNVAARNEVIKVAHDWFGGNPWTGIGTVNGSHKAMLGQNYPNPAAYSTTIPMSGIDKEMRLELVDITGRILMTRIVVEGTTSMVIQTSGFRPGIYFYRLTSNGRMMDTKRMQVIY